MSTKLTCVGSIFSDYQIKRATVIQLFWIVGVITYWVHSSELLLPLNCIGYCSRVSYEEQQFFPAGMSNRKELNEVCEEQLP